MFWYIRMYKILTEVFSIIMYYVVNMNKLLQLKIHAESPEMTLNTQDSNS